MNIHFEKANSNHIEFMKTMLYEAVFWRNNPNKPTIADAMQQSGVSEAIVDFGTVLTDCGVIAYSNGDMVGAAWFRLYTKDRTIRGYIHDDIPVLALAVHPHYRRLGIATGMLIWLLNDIQQNTSFQTLSLCVTKDNPSRIIYTNLGFIDYEDLGDSAIMIYTYKEA